MNAVERYNAVLLMTPYNGIAPQCHQLNSAYIQRPSRRLRGVAACQRQPQGNAPLGAMHPGATQGSNLIFLPLHVTFTPFQRLLYRTSISQHNE